MITIELKEELEQRSNDLQQLHTVLVLSALWQKRCAVLML